MNRRIETQRIVKRRLKLANMFGIENIKPGVLRKYNLVCSCNMCSYPKYKEKGFYKERWSFMKDALESQ